MIFLKLRASFGKLHGELTLHEGMNLLCQPNESGKSTWSAFLLAMLYGIDSSEKSSKKNQNLPDKERYKPWDGSAMEGAAELLWQGRHITIERRTTGRIPMGEFYAYETDSGVPVTELTADNCGGMLCGAERSVFERTAFIRQLGLSVTSDDTLEQRLHALVTTGEEGLSYSALEKKLSKLKNTCSRSGSGQIARRNARLDEVTQQLFALRTAQEEAMQLSAARDEAQERKTELAALTERAQRAHNTKKRAGITELEQKLREQASLCQRLEQTCRTLPEESQLHELQRQLDKAENDLRTAQMEAAFGVSDITPPPAPQYFAGCTVDEAERKAAADVAEYEMLTAQRPPKKLPALLLCALLTAAGIGICFLSLYAGLAIAGCALTALLVTSLLLSKRSAQVREQQHRAELIPTRYGVSGYEEIPVLAQRYAQSMQDYARKQAQVDAQKQASAARIAQQTARIDALILQCAQFAPECSNAQACRSALSAALRAHQALAEQRRAHDSLQQQLASMQMLFGDTPDPAPEDTEALQYDLAALAQEQTFAAERLSKLNAQLAHKRGQISALGDAVALESELETLTEQLASLRETDDALTLALDALKSADETLRARFSPQISADAGRILAHLTDGKYPNILLRPDMHLSTREDGGSLMRSAAAMSAGTADQMYLALRLAMCNHLLPPDAPLVLDDALVNFDDARAAAALSLLREEAQHRQIILFTCHSRERRL